MSKINLKKYVAVTKLFKNMNSDESLSLNAGEENFIRFFVFYVIE